MSFGFHTARNVTGLQVQLCEAKFSGAVAHQLQGAMQAIRA